MRMEIYIEYAFLENFCFDGALIYLSFKGARVLLKPWKWFLSTLFGAVFALVFPLLRLPDFLSVFLKVLMGAWICMLAFGRLKTRKEWGRYAFTLLCFYSLTFLFGGAMLGIFSLSGAKQRKIVVAFLGLCAFSTFLIGKMQERRRYFRFLYPCELFFGVNYAQTEGYLDSGNLATKNGVPICFLSPDLFYDLTKNEKEEGQVFVETEIFTVSGVKSVRLCKGKIRIKTKEGALEREVYFSSSAHMVTREYKMIINVRVFDGWGERNENL